LLGLAATLFRVVAVLGHGGDVGISIDELTDLARQITDGGLSIASRGAIRRAETDGVIQALDESLSPGQGGVA
jgi:hypothetical protein